jgi:hypothetical protein
MKVSVGIAFTRHKRERGQAMTREYRLVIERHYVVWARDYDEALRLINSEKEYDYVVNEILTLLSEKEEAK